MKKQISFHFKAATGFGAVVDGSVTGLSAEQVSQNLISQGLIPVRIWAEQPAEMVRSSRVGRLLQKLTLRRRIPV